MKPFTYYRTPGLFWIRFFGWGIHVKDLRRHPIILFSERDRFAIKLGNWRIKFLGRSWRFSLAAIEHAKYLQQIEEERIRMEENVLDPLLAAWLEKYKTPQPIAEFKPCGSIIISEEMKEQFKTKWTWK